MVEGGQVKRRARHSRWKWRELTRSQNGVKTAQPGNCRSYLDFTDTGATTEVLV